jgi:hypothetical protein
VADLEIFEKDWRNSDHALSFEATTRSCACGPSAVSRGGYIKEQIFVTLSHAGGL